MKKKLSTKYAMYDVRHTGITRMIKAGMDSHVIAKLCGTSVMMIEKHYSHVDDDAAYMSSQVNNAR